MTSKRNLVKLYDAEALIIERYSSKYILERRYHCKRMLILQSFLKDLLPQCESFLDVGCGTGEYLSFSMHYLPQVLGLDISKRYLQRCKPCKVSDLILGDVRALPFKDQAVDCVLCSEVIEHLKEQDVAVLEILRVARKFVLLSTPNHGILRMFMSRFGNHLLARIDARVGHVSILKFSELIQLLQKLKSEQWKVASAFTMHVLPPFLDSTRIPRFAVFLIGMLERFLDLLLPWFGSISVIYLKRNKPLH